MAFRWREHVHDVHIIQHGPIAFVSLRQVLLPRQPLSTLRIDVDQPHDPHPRHAPQRLDVERTDVPGSDQSHAKGRRIVLHDLLSVVSVPDGRWRASFV